MRRRLLDGIRVLDFTTNISGPFATHILSSLGATVWKVERPGIGDDARQMHPVVGGHSAYFTAINPFKRSIALDLKDEKARAAIRRLVRLSDVLVENFRPGVMGKVGLGWRDVRKINPAIIYASISAFGDGGPESRRPGYDALLQARTGLMSVTGHPDQPPVRIGVSTLDTTTGLWAAFAIVAALYERMRSGTGQRVTTSLFETGVSFLAYHLAYLQLTGEEPTPQGSEHYALSPYGSFSAKGGEFVFLGVSNDRQFRQLAEILGRPNWAEDARYRTNGARVEHRRKLRELIESILRKKSAAHWERSLVQAGIPVTRLKTVSEVLRDPQAEALSLFHSVPGPEDKKVKLPKLPLHFSGNSVSTRSARTLAVGADAAEILLEAGFTRREVSRLATGEVEIGRRETRPR